MAAKNLLCFDPVCQNVLAQREMEKGRSPLEQPSALLYVDRIEQHGERLFHLACREDLEGIRDATYGHQFRRRIQSLGMKEVSAPRSPWQNAFAERMIGSIRRAGLDHVGVLSQRDLRKLLKSYFTYYHRPRNASGVGQGRSRIESDHESRRDRRHPSSRR